ncbi:unnamed protein product, partial [Discosporangium mesarthrocarpum]
MEWGSSTAAEGGRYDIYYTVPDKLRRPWQVRRVSLRPSHNETPVRPMVKPGAPWGWEVDGASDCEVFSELDDAFFVDVGKTKDHAYVVLNVHSKTTSEILLLPAGAAAPPRPGQGLELSSGQGKEQEEGEGSGKDKVDRGSGGWQREEAGKGNEGRDTCTGTKGHRAWGAGGGQGLKPVMLRARQVGVEYYVDHAGGDAFYLITNSHLREVPPEDGMGSGGSGAGAGAGSGSNTTPKSSLPLLESGGEYRLVRLDQPPGEGGSLNGLPSAPWKAVLDAPPMCPPSPPHHPAFKAADAEGTKGIGDGSGDGSGSGSGGNGCSGSIRACRKVDDMDLFREHCVLYGTVGDGLGPASPGLQVVPLRDPTSAYHVTIPSPGGGGGGQLAERVGAAGGKGRHANEVSWEGETDGGTGWVKS